MTDENRPAPDHEPGWEPGHETVPASPSEPVLAATEPVSAPDSYPVSVSQPVSVPDSQPDSAPVSVPVTESAQKPAHAKKHRSFFRELPFLIVIAFVLALLIKQFLVQAFYIPSGSMEQTLMVGDRVLVNKIPYVYRGPERGEIVVFNGLDNFDEGVRFAEPTNPVSKVLRKISSTIGLGAPSEKDYIKRVIGVGGDRVMCCDTDGNVVVTPRGGSATSLDEPYLFENDMSGSRYFCEAVAEGATSSKETCPAGSKGVLVPEGRLWVMGDHRSNSSDSRFHIRDQHQGTVPDDKVVGKAFTVVYPFGRAGFLHVPSAFEKVALPATPYGLGLVGALPVVALRRRLRTASGTAPA